MSSRCRCRVVVLGSVSLAVLFQVGTVLAQFPFRQERPGRDRGPRQPEMPAVEPSGTIQGWRPGFIQITSTTGEPWMLRLGENAKVHVTGAAKKDFLRVGLFISFVAQVDKRRSQVQDKVARLTLFTPSEARPPGAFPEGALGEAANAVEEAAPARESRSRRGPASDTTAALPVETFEIAGRIAKIQRSGKITVYAPNHYFKPTVEIELAEEPEIALDLTDPTAYRFAKPGDRLRARGRQLAPNAAQVTEVTIELAEPLTTAQPKKPARRTYRSSRSKRAATDEAGEKAPEPEPDAGQEPEPEPGQEPEEDKP